MAVSRLQKFSQWAQAGWSMVTTGKFMPKNDGTTAFVQYVTPVDESGNVISAGGATPATAYTGQQTVTAAAAALAAQALSNGLTLTAASTNAAPIIVGGAGVTAGSGYLLRPGASLSLSVANANGVYILSAVNTTDTLSWIGN